MTGHTGSRALSVIPVLVLLALVVAPQAHAGVAFPGPGPGAAKGQIDGNNLLLENDVLAIRWDLTGGLHLIEAKDKITGEVWEMDRSECLQFVILQSPSPDPMTLKGSEMELIGQPILRDAEVNYGTGRLADSFPGKELIVQLAARDRSFTVEWCATLRNDSNYVRQTSLLKAAADWVELSEVTLVDVPAKDAEVRGSVDGSPAVAEHWFIGLEHPMSKSEVVDAGGTKRVRCKYPFARPLAPGRTQTYSSVLGIAPQNQIRRSFLYYLERERAHPYRAFLHHNPGEDMGHLYGELVKKPGELQKFYKQQSKWWQQVMEDFGRELVASRHVVIDCFAHDYLWDDTQRPWLFDTKVYPDGFKEPRRTAAKYGATLGIWYSPDAVTGTSGRVPAGIEQKFEGYMVGPKHEAYTRGLSLAGPRYFARLRSSAVNMLRKNGVCYFKFDGIADGYKYDCKPFGAGPFASDYEALLELYTELRSINPNVFINSSTGAWPSPFLLRWADSIWHQGADVGEYGPQFEGWSKGSPRQRWITYRDSATYHNGWLRGPLYPLNSYMLHGIEYNLCSTGVGRRRVDGLEPKDFIDEIHSFFGTGTDLQEMYINAGLMKPQTWDALAEAANWSRANSDVLADTHWVGGDPAKQAVYGWASWNARKGILTLRNPDDQPQTISVDLAEVFELPKGAQQKYRLTSPWRDQANEAVLELTAGTRHDFHLQPFEVRVLDAVPY